MSNSKTLWEAFTVSNSFNLTTSSPIFTKRDNRKVKCCPHNFFSMTYEIAKQLESKDSWKGTQRMDHTSCEEVGVTKEASHESMACRRWVGRMAFGVCVDVKRMRFKQPFLLIGNILVVPLSSAVMRPWFFVIRSWWNLHCLQGSMAVPLEALENTGSEMNEVRMIGWKSCVSVCLLVEEDHCLFVLPWFLAFCLLVVWL